MAEREIYIENDNFLRFSEMRDVSQSLNSFLASGTTVQVTLFDLAGTTVSGMTFPLTLTYNSALGRGTFEGTLQDTLALTAWTHYNLVVETNSAVVPKLKETIRVFARIRGLY